MDDIPEYNRFVPDLIDMEPPNFVIAALVVTSGETLSAPAARGRVVLMDWIRERILLRPDEPYKEYFVGNLKDWLEVVYEDRKKSDWLDVDDRRGLTDRSMMLQFAEERDVKSIEYVLRHPMFMGADAHDTEVRSVTDFLFEAYTRFKDDLIKDDLTTNSNPGICLS